MINKKILIISNKEVTSVTGGTITVFNNLCMHFANLNNFVYPTIFSKDDKPLSIKHKNIFFENLYIKYNSNNYSKCVNFYINEIKPDLIIFFFPSMFYEANIDKKYSNIPKIIMFHSRPDIYFSSNFFNFKKFEKLYSNTTSQILFKSYVHLLPNLFKNNPTISIPNCIKMPKKHIDVNVTKHKIIYLSRVDSYKGIELLINSFSLISEKYKDWIIDIYGESQPKYYSMYLNKLINKKHLSGRINLKGITNNSLETLSNYDFCVFPSYFEGFPMGLLEALSVGLPTIGLKGCSGVNEMILNNVNGILTDDNPTDYSNKIEQLIINKDLRMKMSKNAILLSQQYSSDIVFKQWDVIIDRIIKKRKIVANYNFNNELTEIYPIKKILKMDGFAKKIFIKCNITNFPIKFLWLLAFIFFKVFLPDGSKRQSIFKKIYYKIKF